MKGSIIKSKIKFGKQYTDVNSGFTGIAVAISKWQYGCIRIGLQPKWTEGQKQLDAEWFDEDALIESKKEKKRGGPTPSPKLNPNPVR